MAGLRTTRYIEDRENAKIKPMDDQIKPQPASKKILVVEDEHFISELYVRALTKAGHQVSVVNDGQVALEKAKTNAFDIILLDIMLPNLSGQEILKSLRDPAQTPNLHSKIIITTNLELSDEERLAIERQADGYIVKAEVTPKELVTFLSQLQTN